MCVRTSSDTFVFVFIALLFNVILFQQASSLHLYGRWDPNEDFFLFLSKFGFQKTELANKNDTQGFIFGNFTEVPFTHVVKTDWTDLPPEALIPKIRVPRSVLPTASLNTTVENGTSSNVTIKNASHASVSKVVNSTNLKNASSTEKQSSAPGKNDSSHQPPNQNQSMVSETFISRSKSPLPPTHVNFSTNVSTSSTPAASSPSPSSPTSTSASSTTSKQPSTVSTLKPSTVATPTKASTRLSTTSKSTTSKPSTPSTTPIPLPAIPPPATLVVVDRGFFLEFYKNRVIETEDKDETCKRMFTRISQVSHDPFCYPEGTENLLRRIPCPKDGICLDDLIANKSVVKGHQFTYAISDLSKAKFWYVSLVPCFRNPATCEWEYSSNMSAIDYDIWLVNGNPYTKNQNPLEYQFSFDRQDTVEIYLVFFLCYLILVPLQIHAVLRQRHIVPKLFTASVALELTAVTSNVIHVLKFAVDGEGHPGLAVFGDVMDIIARAIFMLILLVLAKGWAVTRTELTSKPLIFSIWLGYGIVHILLYVWKETEVSVIQDIDEYQTWPGWMILILRTVIMIWFLYELKDTMDHEHTPHKLNFFLHFGAAALVWFIYLPIVALIALQVSPLWRSKFLLGITYSADCLAFAIMTHLLWPTRTEQYFLLMSKDAVLTDELEEFNEAPHVVNSYVRRPNHWYPVNYSFHDVSSPEAVSLTQGNTLQNLNHQYPHQRFTTGTNGFTSEDVKDNVPLIIT